MIACLCRSTLLVVAIVVLLGTFDSTHLLPAEEPENSDSFLRGDVNTDGVVDLADALYLLSWLVQEGQAPDCLKAADVNDDGVINLEDYVFLKDCLLFDDVMPSRVNPTLCLPNVSLTAWLGPQARYASVNRV